MQGRTPFLIAILTLSLLTVGLIPSAAISVVSAQPNGGVFAQWSPDGSKLVFSALGRDNPLELWYVSVSDNDFHQLGTGYGQWLSDSVVVAKDATKDGTFLWTVDLASAARKPIYRIDGRGFAVSCDRNIAVWGLSNGKTRLQVYHSIEALTKTIAEYKPGCLLGAVKWSPDSRMLAFGIAPVP